MADQFTQETQNTGTDSAKKLSAGDALRKFWFSSNGFPKDATINIVDVYDGYLPGWWRFRNRRETADE